MKQVCFLIVAVTCMIGSNLRAEDWRQFRGPYGAASSADANLPEIWSDSENLQWKTELPGPGSSSPIVVGDHVFVTSYSGYGVPKSPTGDLKSLKRHLVCISRNDGKIKWTKTIADDTPEDGYQGYISEHGYASNTPVSDGERVYCFFGKSGVLAFDLAGNELWRVNVGKESSNRRWGSAASLILHKSMLIVNASEESQSIRALDKLTGKEIWKAAGSAMELAYGTPMVVSLKDRDDVVVAVPGEVWGLNSETGKLRWFAEHQLTGNICPSIVANGETIYVFGGFRSSGSLALKVGGDQKDVTKSNVLWTDRNSSYVATPVLAGENLYWVNDAGQAYCVSAKTGALVYRERVPGLDAGGRPVYASPVVANGKIYVPTRWSGVLVIAAKPEFKILSQNKFAGDESDFNATPAISNGQLFLRSNRYLYSVASKK